MSQQQKSRQLILWRHARSPWSEPDIERELDQLGNRQAQHQASELSSIISHSDAPWTLVCSPARRTQQTLQALLDQRPELAGRLHTERQIYNASTHDLKSLLEDYPGNLLLVGHNPALSQLACWLVVDQSHIALSPASFARVELSGAPDSGTGQLLELRYPPDSSVN